VQDRNATEQVNPQAAAGGLSDVPDERLSALIRAAYESGQNWVMDTPGVPVAVSAERLAARVAAGIRWMLANPAASIPEDDPVQFVRAIAYYSGVRSTVDQFMQVPKIQREVAQLFAPASVPGQRSSTDESGS
jgi:hypothetical protein